MAPLFVINAGGEREPFSFEKAYRSARRAGASRETAQRIAKTIRKELYPGIKTAEIFKRIKSLLYQETPKAALKFSLKEGMRKLGPTGFPFEKYTAEIFKNLGYKTSTNQFLPGRCMLSHEIDFMASKDNLIYIGECKYRNLSGERIHSKDALANFARYVDILNGPRFQSKKYKGLKIKTIMVTNTKFTSQTIDYARCMGFDLLGWNYPRNRGLEYLIEKEKLYPITILPSFKGYLKEPFAKKRKMLAMDVLNTPIDKLAKTLGLRKKEIEKLVREAKILLG